MTIVYILLATTLLAIATPFILAYAFPHKVNSNEVLISIGCSVVITLISLGIVFSDLHNTELLHGQVTSKERQTVSCEHSYSCNCRTTTNSQGHSTTECDTCYEHSNDYDWVVKSTVGEIEIKRIDEQGKKEPPRFTSVQKGDPVAVESWYIDYVSASSKSLFNLSQHSTNPVNVKYPSVYDYYNTNLVINQSSVSKEVVQQMNSELRMHLRTLAAKKQSNIIVVLTNKDRSFANDIQYAWNNGRKNDQVVVIGVGDANNIAWAYAFGWSKNQMVNIAIRDELQQMETFDGTEVINTITKNVEKYFNRTPMAEYKYLLSDVEVPTWAIIFIMLLQIGGNIGIAVFIVNNRR